MARKPIIQRIELDGGKAIEKQLLDIGEAGEKALRQIAAAAVKADLSKFGASLSKVGTAFGHTINRIKLLTGTLAALDLTATGVAAAFFLNSKNAAEYADAIADAAEKTGLQVDAFQELASVAGVSQDQFVASLTNLNRSIAKTAGISAKGSKQFAAAIDGMGGAFQDGASALEDTGVKLVTESGELVSEWGEDMLKAGKKAGGATLAAAAAFQQLGVKVKDASGRLRPTEDVLADIADRFAAMPDGARKSAFALALFGESAAEMIPFLNKGSQAIREQGKALEENGLKLTDAQIAIGGEMTKALGNLGKAFKGVRVQIGLMFAPVFTQAAQEFRDIINANRVAIVEFVRSVAVQGIGILHDFFNALRGRGVVERPWVQEWTDAFLVFGKAVVTVVNTIIIPTFNIVRKAAQLVADGINAIFPTDVTATEVLVTAGLLKFLGILGLVGTGLKAALLAVDLFWTGLTILGGIVEGVVLELAVLVGWPALLVAAFVAAGIAIFVFWDDIKAAAAATWDYLTSSATAMWDTLESIFRNGVQTISGIISSLIEKIGNAIAAMKRLIATATSAPTGALAGAQTSKARGGYIRGPGTGTSDSILARLSTGEFVIRAAAVRKFGASFFASLNALRMPAFSPGGLVRGLERSMAQMMPIPRYAAGGLAMAPAGASGRPVNLTFPGGESFALIAPENVAEKLARFASNQALRSAGRKPGWYR